MSAGILLVSLVLTHFGIYCWGVVKGARLVIRMAQASAKVKTSDLYPEKKND